jgi:hypothetical protein
MRFGYQGLAPEELCENAAVELLILGRERTDEDRHQREALLAHHLHETRTAYDMHLSRDIQNGRCPDIMR